MAEKTRTYLKGKFESGDTPTEQDFIDLIDSNPNFTDDKDYYGIENNITAYAGGGQTNAYELTNKINVVITAVNPYSSIKLPSGLKGRIYTLYNKNTNSVTVFPPVGGYLNNLAINAGHTIGSYTHLIMINYDTNKWQLCEIL